MSTRRNTMLASILLAASASFAHAEAVLITPAVWGGAGGTGYWCFATNLGKKPVEVTVDIIDIELGIVTETNTQTVDPLKSVLVYEGAPSNQNSLCRATGLSKKTGTVTMVSSGMTGVVQTVTAP